MSDRHIVIDNGEVVNLTFPATSPEALWRGAAYLKRQAAKMAFENKFQLRPIPHDPFNGGVADMLDDNHVAEDPSITEERERQYRTMRALAEIELALAEEERQTKQQQQRANQEARSAFRATAIGRLIGRYR